MAGHCRVAEVYCRSLVVTAGHCRAVLPYDCSLIVAAVSWSFTEADMEQSPLRAGLHRHADMHGLPAGHGNFVGIIFLYSYDVALDKESSILCAIHAPVVP